MTLAPCEAGGAPDNAPALALTREAMTHPAPPVAS